MRRSFNNLQWWKKYSGQATAW